MLGPTLPGSEPRYTLRSLAPAGVIVILALVATLAACGDDGRQLRPPAFPAPTSTTAPPTTINPEAPPPAVTAPPVTVAAMQLVAPWPDGAAVPARHTCDDADVSPALSWTNVPAGTIELALTFTDIDAGFTHWVMTGINAARTSLAESELPTEATVRTNDFGEAVWAGPCPPAGEPGHTYLVTLHALNQQVEVADDAATEDVISFLNSTVLAQSSVAGTYARAG